MRKMEKCRGTQSVEIDAFFFHTKIGSILANYLEILKATAVVVVRHRTLCSSDDIRWNIPNAQEPKDKCCDQNIVSSMSLGDCESARNFFEMNMMCDMILCEKYTQETHYNDFSLISHYSSQQKAFRPRPRTHMNTLCVVSFSTKSNVFNMIYHFKKKVSLKARSDSSHMTPLRLTTIIQSN